MCIRDSGTIDLIATDHAPHSAEEKSKPVTEAPSGIIGLETSLALGDVYKRQIYGSPSIAEEALVARDCLLALRSGAEVVIQHISSGVSVDIVRTYKKLGARLHAEATPHHFTLTEDAVLELSLIHIYVCR